MFQVTVTRSAVHRAKHAIRSSNTRYYCMYGSSFEPATEYWSWPTFTQTSTGQAVGQETTPRKTHSKLSVTDRKAAADAGSPADRCCLVISRYQPDIRGRMVLHGNAWMHAANMSVVASVDKLGIRVKLRQLLCKQNFTKYYLETDLV